MSHGSTERCEGCPHSAAVCGVEADDVCGFWGTRGKGELQGACSGMTAPVPGLLRENMCPRGWRRPVRDVPAVAVIWSLKYSFHVWKGPWQRAEGALTSAEPPPVSQRGSEPSVSSVRGLP